LPCHNPTLRSPVDSDEICSVRKHSLEYWLILVNRLKSVRIYQVDLLQDSFVDL